MKTLMTAGMVLVVLLGAAAYGADRATLTGIVTGANGKPLDDATVMVYQAGVRTGYNEYCPSCYTDCGKRTTTDAAGHYSISGLSRDLWFNVLVVKSGYTPTFVKHVDPLQGSAPAASLASRSAVDDPRRVVRGHVVDEQGSPVRDAVVETEGILLTAGDLLGGLPVGAGTTIYGSLQGLGDSVAVTDHEGNFEFAYTQPGEKLALMVEPRAVAPKLVILPFGSERQTVTVIDGGIVRGRLMKNGKPVANAEIGLRPQQPWSGLGNLEYAGSWYQEIRIGTRPDGTFAITGVPAPEQWNLFGKMESLASQGATDPVAVSTDSDHQDVNLGDIVVKPGYRLRGQVLLSDGKSIANGMRVSVAFDRTQDVQTAVLPADGHFEFGGLAPGKYSGWASVKGYKADQDTDTQVDHNEDGVVLKLHPAGSGAVAAAP